MDESTKINQSRQSILGPKVVQSHQTLLKYLTNSEYENLDWEEPFGYEGLVRIRTPMDGSCFFHAIAKSYFRPYILGRKDNKPFDRTEFIKNLRKSLAVKLGSRVKPSDPRSPTHYEVLSRGQLPEFAKSVPSYSLINMQKLLDSNRAVDNVFNEFISNQLDKDIYILDAIKRDVYITGFDDDILYKDRPSIIILYLPGHYELVGLNENGSIKVLFEPDHDLVKTVRARMTELHSLNNFNRTHL